jgi:cytoskeletal protein CcmA (bactofilin family)
MFSKPDTPTPPQRSVTSNAGKSLLASDLRIVGEITSAGAIEVLGEVEGNLTARSLVIGAEGRLSGSVSAETVEVKGKLDGRVSTEDFTLRSAAQVQADVTYKTLMIESGAQIDGRFQKPKA